MAIRGVHHTGIIVKNLDRSIYFYHDLLGLEFDREPSPWFSGDELGKAVGVPGASLRQVCLRAGNDILELLEYGNPPEHNDAPPTQNQLGAMHVGLRVDDIVATKADLESKGVVFLSEVNVVDDGVLADGVGSTCTIRTASPSNSSKRHTARPTSDRPESRPTSPRAPRSRA